MSEATKEESKVRAAGTISGSSQGGQHTYVLKRDTETEINKERDDDDEEAGTTGMSQQEEEQEHGKRCV